MIANIMPISLRIQQLILRHWIRAKSSSAHHPLYKIHQQFHPQTKKPQLPFDIAYNILKNNNTNITIIQDINPTPGPITALRKYDIFQIPTNYDTAIEPIKSTQIDPLENNIYTDGSCNPNPGKGAYGWFAPNYNGTTRQQTIAYKYPTTITNCEIMAILISLLFIKDNPPTPHHVNIFTDCKLILQYLNFESYPKYNNIRALVQAIFKTLTIIKYKHPKITISFIKVKSQTDIMGNNIIDKKCATTNKIKYNKHNFKHVPYSVTLTQIYKFTTKSWKANWKVKSNPIRWLSIYHNKFDNRIHNLINTAKLNKNQCGI